ncbi:MAG: hypothetical protein ACRDFS_05515 [Chloroflexota bacterium]
MLRSILFAAIVLAGMPMAARANTPGASSGDTPTLKAATARLTHHSRSAVVHWLREQPVVLSAWVGADGRTIAMTFVDGRHAAILPRPLTPLRISRHGALTRRAIAQSLGNARAVGRALVDEPFASELGLGQEAGLPEVNALQAAGLKVDQLIDKQVTVQSYLNLAQYNVVYMETHSGVLGTKGDAIVASGELVNPSNDAALASYINDGSVWDAQVGGDSTDLFYAITSKFVTDHIGTFPAHSIMFVDGCALLNQTLFWQALQNKGEGALITWDGDSTAQADYLAGSAFMQQMSEGASVSAAMQSLKSGGYATSVLNGSTANLGFEGDGNITLAQAAGSPISAPTATPTTGPTATNPPPTAMPTAVPTPTPPQLQIITPARAKPGVRQLINVNTAPGTTVRVEVYFPSGSHRTFGGTTGPAGAASFSFVQQAGRIIEHHSRARVVVRATRNGLVTTQTIYYHIGYAALDIAAVPRTVASGSRVKFWLHTHKRTLVRLKLHLPDGKTHTLRTKTGGKGWSHPSYRVGQIGTGKVRVYARARVRGKTVKGYTWFAVK